ncbi:MAG: hypothetical protein U1E41_00825 [Paracoccus sp. (in: a-proteobacteria)]
MAISNHIGRTLAERKVYRDKRAAGGRPACRNIVDHARIGGGSGWVSAQYRRTAGLGNRPGQILPMMRCGGNEPPPSDFVIGFRKQTIRLRGFTCYAFPFQPGEMQRT